jgi:homoserine O-succinyltransferase
LTVVLAKGRKISRAPNARSSVVIGLVNSMPGEAFSHTEQQFCGLLSAASRGMTVHVRFFSLTNVPRADQGRTKDGPCYESFGKLDTAALDGLLVTGTPPRAAALVDEPYWPKLAALVDFARDRGIPAVWSCLAAHAAVLHIDGIERRPLGRKLSGLVECVRTTSEHPIVTGVPLRWRVPHSRYNELPEDVLVASGYRILSRSAEAGADMFSKQVGGLFLFCQGHPEYDLYALLREYRRDIRLFLSGKRDSYPDMPRNYFSLHSCGLLNEFRECALKNREVDLLDSFPTAACENGLTHSWRDLTVQIYANWLAHIAGQIGHRRTENPSLPLQSWR